MPTLTQAQLDENKRINDQMLATQQANSQARLAKRTGTTTVTPWQEITTNGQGIGINAWPVRTPTTPVNTPADGSVSSILGDNTMWVDQQFIEDYIAKQNATYNTPIDEAAIRKQKEAEMQAQIDAINKVYADKLNQSRIQWQGRIGSNVAQQARGGLLGSDFGTAQQNTIQDVNTQANNLVEQERLSLVNALLSDARKNASDEIAAKRKAVEEGGKALLDYYAWAGERKATKTKSIAQKLIALGKNPGDLTDAEFAQLKIDKNDLAAEYNMLDQAQAEADFKRQQDQEKAALEALKTQSEIDKNQADIINNALKTGRVYTEGGFIFDGATNELIGNAQAVRKASGGSGGGWGTVVAGYINPTGNASLDLQQVELPSKATEFSKKSYWFGTRMAESEDSIAAIENLYKTSGTTKEFINNVLPSFLQSAEMQKYNQAKRNFVNAVLRNESGAVISDSEFSNADKQYFPQPWDTPEVLAQKAKNRDLVTSNMFSSAGKDARGNSIKDIYQVVKQQNQQAQTPPPNTTQTPVAEDAYATYLKSIGQ